MSLHKPKGECVYCGATAEFTKGDSGESGVLRWSNNAVEVYSSPANASVCPPCWETIKEKRRALASKPAKRKAQKRKTSGDRKGSGT